MAQCLHQYLGVDFQYSDMFWGGVAGGGDASIGTGAESWADKLLYLSMCRTGASDEAEMSKKYGVGDSTEGREVHKISVTSESG